MSFVDDDIVTTKIPHSMGWMGLLSHNFGPTRGRNLKLEPVDTTPLAFMMVSQGFWGSRSGLFQCVYHWQPHWGW